MVLGTELRSTLPCPMALSGKSRVEPWMSLSLGPVFSMRLAIGRSFSSNCARRSLPGKFSPIRTIRMLAAVASHAKQESVGDDSKSLLSPVAISAYIISWHWCNLHRRILFMVPSLVASHLVSSMWGILSLPISKACWGGSAVASVSRWLGRRHHRFSSSQHRSASLPN